MKLSSNTMKILKNYSTINNNMVFTQGSVLRTRSAAGNIYSLAEIEEEIPLDFALYDLSTLLAMISCSDDYEINFQETNLEIVSNMGMFEIYYCDDSAIVHPVKEAKPIDIIHSFEVSAEDLQTLMKAISVTSAPYLTIKCNEKEVILEANDRKSQASNSYKKKIGNFDKKFDVFCRVENLRCIPNDYTVSIAVSRNKRNPLLYFCDKDKKVQYWIAGEIGSKA